MQKKLYSILKNTELTLEEKDAIEMVDVLLTEYAWSNDPMDEKANNLKNIMLEVFKYWISKEQEFFFN